MINKPNIIQYLHMFWLLWVFNIANWSGKENQLQHSESAAFPFNIENLQAVSIPSACPSLQSCDFTAHDLPESPDETKWNWVHRSYDWGRRNHPHNNYSLTLLCHWLAGHFFIFFSVYKREIAQIKITGQNRSDCHSLKRNLIGRQPCVQTVVRAITTTNWLTTPNKVTKLAFHNMMLKTQLLSRD